MVERVDAGAAVEEDAGAEVGGAAGAVAELEVIVAVAEANGHGAAENHVVDTGDHHRIETGTARKLESAEDVGALQVDLVVAGAGAEDESAEDVEADHLPIVNAVAGAGDLDAAEHGEVLDLENAVGAGAEGHADIAADGSFKHDGVEAALAAEHEVALDVAGAGHGDEVVVVAAVGDEVAADGDVVEHARRLARRGAAESAEFGVREAAGDAVDARHGQGTVDRCVSSGDQDPEVAIAHAEVAADLDAVQFDGVEARCAADDDIAADAAAGLALELVVAVAAEEDEVAADDGVGVESDEIVAGGSRPSMTGRIRFAERIRVNLLDETKNNGPKSGNLSGHAKRRGLAVRNCVICSAAEGESRNGKRSIRPTAGATSGRLPFVIAWFRLRFDARTNRRCHGQDLSQLRVSSDRAVHR